MTTTQKFESAKKTSPGLVLLAWLFVGIPLIWGVSQTFMNALNLFHPAASAPAAANMMSPTTAPASVTAAANSLPQVTPDTATNPDKMPTTAP